MKKEIREVKNGIVQITTVDERWYARPRSNATTGLPEYEFVPSVTWICDFYPKGVGFYKWLADKGWDESQSLKEAGGIRGTKVHAAIEDLLAGMTVKMEDGYTNPSTDLVEPLTLEEYQCIISFVAWYKAVQPEIVGHDLTVWNEVEKYAGTIDLICKIDGILTLVDFKTSKAVWPSHRMQVSAYKHALTDKVPWFPLKVQNLSILQLGYTKNRLGYKETDVTDCYDLFLHAKGIWAEETKGQHPPQRDYPLTITLAAPTPTKAVAPSGTNASSQKGGK